MVKHEKLILSHFWCERGRKRQEVQHAPWTRDQGKVAMPTTCRLSGGHSPGVRDQGEEIEMQDMCRVCGTWLGNSNSGIDHEYGASTMRICSIGERGRDRGRAQRRRG